MKSKNSGINISTSIVKNSKQTIGVNAGKGRKQRNWTQNQTNITAQNTGTIKVGNETTLVGSVINSENKVITMDTKKLTTTDITDTQKETNGQIGLIGITKGKVSQTTVGYNQKDKEQITRTTLSNVNVVEDGKVVDLTKRQINQDLEKSQEIIKDKEKSFDTSLHTDLLDEETRKQVIRDFKRIIQLPVKIVDGIIYSNTVETHKKTGKVAEKELGKSIRASVRDLNIETLLKTKELRNDYKKQLTDTMNNGQLTDESLKVASKVILGVLAQNGIENPSIVFSTDEKLVKSVAKTDTNHFIINLNNIDITNYDNLIDLMQYEGQRFSYSDKETDDVTANQGMDLDKYLGKTNISSDSELLRRGNEFVSETDLTNYWNRDAGEYLDFDNKNKKQLSDLKIYTQKYNKLPEGTIIVIEYSKNEQYIFNSYKELKEGTERENLKIKEYSDLITQKILEEKKEKNPNKKKQLKNEIDVLHIKQDKIIKAIQLRTSIFGDVSRVSELVNNTKSYRNKTLVINGENYSNSLKENITAVGLDLINHSSAMNTANFGNIKSQNVGNKESLSGVARDNKNNPRVVKSVVGNKTIIDKSVNITKEIDKNFNKLSQQEKDIFYKYEKSGWKGQVSGGPAYAGKEYRNFDKKLPLNTRYREFDVNKKMGKSRDSVRFLRGDNGTVYYTDDHYKTFIRIK